MRNGFEVYRISVKCDSTKSLPAISIVGLASKTTEETKDHIRSALRNSQLELPAKKYTINLAPADIPKNDFGLWLAMAVALLDSTGHLQQSSIARKMLLFRRIRVQQNCQAEQRHIIEVRGVKDNLADNVVFISRGNSNEASLLAASAEKLDLSAKALHKNYSRRSYYC